MIPEFATCCTNQQSFCGCESFGVFCTGYAFSNSLPTYSYGTCYDPSSFNCAYNPDPNTWILCPLNYTTCISENEGASPTCCAPGTTCNLANFGAQCVPSACGASECGDTELCCDDKLRGPLCYAPPLYQCINNTLCGCSSYENCNVDVCGTICYDANQYLCCDAENGLLAQLSVGCVEPIPEPGSCGSRICGEDESCCDDGLIGPTCFDSDSYACVRNEVLCGCENESCNVGACGTVCFDADSYVCCSGDELNLISVGCSN